MRSMSFVHRSFFKIKNTPTSFARHFQNRPNLFLPCQYFQGTNLRNFSSFTKSDDRIFTPDGFSSTGLSSIYTQNLKILDTKIQGENFTNTVHHFESISHNKVDLLPMSGSLVHLKTTDDIESSLSNSFGIVLNDLNFSLSKVSTYRVLLPNGEITEINADHILFTIPMFIRREMMKAMLIDESVLPVEHLLHLTYTLNVFLLFFTKMVNVILKKDLIRTLYLKSAFMNYQSSLNLTLFSIGMYDYSKSLRNTLDIKTNPMGSHVLLLSCHFLIYNDPIHFRYIKSKNSIFNLLNPMNQVTTKYFYNPILLSQNLENIYAQPIDLIVRSYFGILKKSNEFQIYNILKTDENFKRLILMVKYSIVYPDSKLVNKLKALLPIDVSTALSPKVLFEFLVKIGIYDKDTNALISSGFYGLNMYDPTDLSLPVKNVNELQYAYHKGQSFHELPKSLQRMKPLKPVGDEKKEGGKFANRSYSNSFLDVIQDSKLKIWPKSLVRNRRTVYKLTKTIAFSVSQESLTNYRFNIFIPIPNQSPNENITVQEPIQIDNNVVTFPKLEKFNHALRINQPCIRLTFNHNLIDSDSLTSPNIKVGLDSFKKIENIDEEWFKNRNFSSLKGSKKKLDCWLSLNKLMNLLIEKEKSRVRLGYLKTFGDFDESNRNFLNFKTFFIDNKSNEDGSDIKLENVSNTNSAADTHNSTTVGGGNLLNENENYMLRDKRWITENLKLLIDENLSRFCSEKGVNVANRSVAKRILNSVDYRVFKKFKIFKWYANSYETFNFQLSSNPGDLTAYVSCLAFLGEGSYFFNNPKGTAKNITNENGYTPLGLKHFSSFTSLNYIETHLNLWQLFRYLAIESFELVEDRNKQNWDPLKLDKVTNSHYNKCLSQTEGYLEFINRLNRFEVLRNIQKDVSGGTNIHGYMLMRCVVTSITQERIIGYWFEKDIEVEIIVDSSSSKSKTMIGDRLLCSEVVSVNPLEDVIVVR